MNDKEKDLPFDVSLDEEGTSEQFPPFGKKEERCQTSDDKEDSLDNNLYKTMDAMVHTLKRMQECLLRVATPQMRFCPPKYLQNLESCLREYDFISDIRINSPGYRSYVINHCEGKDPLEDVSFKLDKDRLLEGASWLNDYEAYDFSWKQGTIEEIFAKLFDLYYEPAATDYDAFEELLFLAQRSFKYMTCDRNAMLYLNKRFILEREKKDKILLAMKDELLLLYHSLREAGVVIPSEGHYVDLNAFADRSDPQVGQYEGGYDLNQAYFDYSGIEWD